MVTSRLDRGVENQTKWLRKRKNIQGINYVHIRVILNLFLSNFFITLSFHLMSLDESLLICNRHGHLEAANH